MPTFNRPYTYRERIAGCSGGFLMKCPFEEHIHDLLVSGRINEATAEILTRHYAKQPDAFKQEMASAPREVNLAHLMRLVDLLDKKNEMRRAAASSHPEAQESSGENVSKDLAPASSWETEKRGLEARCEDLRKKCEALEAELVTEKAARSEFERKAFDYAKRSADAEEERRRLQASEEEKRKMLEEEHRRLTEEIQRKQQEEKSHFEKSVQEYSAELMSLGQEKERLLQKLEGGREEQQKVAERIKSLEEAAAQAEVLKNRCADLEREMERIRNENGQKDAANAAAQAELDRMRGERDEKGRCLENAEKKIKEAEAFLNEKGAALAALDTELKKEKEMRLKAETQFRALEKTLLDLERQIDSLH